MLVLNRTADTGTADSVAKLGRDKKRSLNVANWCAKPVLDSTNGGDVATHQIQFPCNFQTDLFIFVEPYDFERTLTSPTLWPTAESALV